MVLLSAVRTRQDAGEVLEALLGACLQNVLEKHGNGLEGTALTAEFDKLLSLVIHHPSLITFFPELELHYADILVLSFGFFMALSAAQKHNFRVHWSQLAM